MQQYYLSDLQSGINQLGAEESRHIVRVMRLRKGDTVMLTNGMGVSASCKLLNANIDGLHLETITWKSVPKPRHEICLAISPLKHPDRFEWLVEKATELGVSRIIPIICKRTEKPSLRHDRLIRLAQAAAIQSLRCWFPIIDNALPFATFVSTPFEGDKAIAWCETNNRKKFTEVINGGRSSLLLVGPEGDFTPDEVDLACSNGFVPITLGELRLRSETAGLYMVQAAKMLEK